MDSIARKVLTESVGQAVAMAAASSSTPSPFPNEDGSYLTSPFSTSSDIKPVTAIIIIFLFIAFFLIGFLSVRFQRCYYTHGARIGHDDNSPPTTQGLDISILESLPKVIFSSSSNSIQSRTKGRKKEMTECAICLEAFLEQETLLLLPHCGHTFHLDCINVWLFSHTTCPLCRQSLLSSKPDPDTIAIGVAYLNDVAVGEEQLRSNAIAAMMDAANSVASEAMQRRVLENPVNPSEEGELSGNHVELRRSHSMGYHSLVKGKLPASSSSSSSSPLLFFIVHRSSSCTVLSNLSTASESGPAVTMDRPSNGEFSSSAATSSASLSS